MYLVLIRILKRTLRLTILLSIVLVIASCAIKSKDLMPESFNPPPGNPQFEGSVNVQLLIDPTIFLGERDLEKDQYIYHLFGRNLWKSALEESIAKNNLFTQVSKGNANYVLDVWIMAVAHMPSFIGDYAADLSSIWRLTRVSDGKVLVCDFVDGHGVFTPGMAPLQRTVVSAARNMIQNGLLMLSDNSVPRRSAFPARIWPSMGAVVTEDLQRLRLSWSKLRFGFTLAEVDKLLDLLNLAMPVVKTEQVPGIIGDAISFTDHHVSKDSVKIEITYEGSSFMSRAMSISADELIEEYITVTAAYRLIFVNGQLKQWERGELKRWKPGQLKLWELGQPKEWKLARVDDTSCSLILTLSRQLREGIIIGFAEKAKLMSELLCN